MSCAERGCLPLRETGVALTLETRSADHLRETVTSLQKAGYEVTLREWPEGAVQSWRWERGGPCIGGRYCQRGSRSRPAVDGLHCRLVSVWWCGAGGSREPLIDMTMMRVRGVWTTNIVASGMNTVLPMIGGAVATQLAVTLLVRQQSDGLPTTTRFGHALWLLTGFMLLATLASLLAPHHRAPAVAERSDPERASTVTRWRHDHA